VQQLVEKDGQPLRAVYQAVAEPELRHDDRGGAGWTIRRGFPIRLRPKSAASVDEKQDLLGAVESSERLNRIGDILEIRARET